MSIIELGALGEFLGSIGVIATLIYLAIQIRQNTHSMDEGRKLALAQTFQSRTEMRLQGSHLMADSDYLPEIDVKLRDAGYPADTEAVKALTPVERRRMGAWENAQAAMLENLHYQFRQGLLEPDHYREVTVPVIRSNVPAWRALGIERGFSSRFQAEIERILAESEENEQ